jgi:hypothetical protein
MWLTQMGEHAAVRAKQVCKAACRLLDEFGQCNKTVDVDYWQRESE